MKILITLLLIINLIINSLFLKSYFIKPQVVPEPYKFNEKQVEYLLQKRQLSLNKPLYIESQFLCDIASIRLEEIQRNWSHFGFSAKRFCPTNCSVGENLAKGNYTESETITAWENSILHAEILNTQYNFFCVKHSKGYTVAVFGNF